MSVPAQRVREMGPASRQCVDCRAPIARASAVGQPPKRCASCRVKTKPHRGAAKIDRPCLGCGATIGPGGNGTVKRCVACNHAHQNGIKARGRLADPTRYRAVKKRSRTVNAKVERAGHLRRTFGITLADYERMEQEQGGRCAVCAAMEAGGRGTWHVDHDHATGRVRALLCLRCNAMLGHARDREDVLAAGIAYLRHHAAIKAPAWWREQHPGES